MPATSGRHTISLSILWVCNSAASKNAAAGAAAGENDGDPILRRAARWLILKGQQHEHQQDGRRRLLALYGEGIDIDADTQRDLVERSEGVSGAFIKELTRQAWLRDALERRDGPTAEDLRRVLDELLEERSTLTRRLLGQPGDGDGVAQGGGVFPGMVHALNAAGLPIPPSPSTGDDPL